ncbi:MAG: LPXTG cell wall anchor domain-containing protein, partial [Verrucomicrobia bacterium]|nr:LPXTG cell wall anchor domain-containing protein [Verrucomicrobiota bacterium]
NIPTIIASVYGMNVELPFSKDTHAFVIVMTGIILFSLFALLFFRRKRWL